jgi:hypothetical protein
LIFETSHTFFKNDLLLKEISKHKKKETGLTSIVLEGSSTIVHWTQPNGRNYPLPAYTGNRGDGVATIHPAEAADVAVSTIRCTPGVLQDHLVALDKP